MKPSNKTAKKPRLLRVRSRVRAGAEWDEDSDSTGVTYTTTARYPAG